MITGIVITLNESKNISECIDSLKQVCSEVIVVDSCSTDDTQSIAKKAGAIVVEQSYLGDGFQKNVGLPYATNDWILSLDADERLTENVVKEIQGLDLENTEHDGFALRRRNHVGSRWIKHCGWYPDYCIRLYNRQKTKFSEVTQHASVQAQNVKQLNADLIHYSFANIGELFAKPGRNFTGRGAKVLYKKGKRANSFTPAIHGLSAFIKKYFFQKGFLGGVDGLSVALSGGINSYLKYAKLLELQRDPKVLENEDLDKIW